MDSTSWLNLSGLSLKPLTLRWTLLPREVTTVSSLFPGELTGMGVLWGVGVGMGVEVGCGDGVGVGGVGVAVGVGV